MLAFSPLSEDINQVRLVIRLRWAGVVFIGAAALVNLLFSPYDLTIFWIITLFVSTYNLLAHLHTNSIAQRKPLAWRQELRLALNLQIALDILTAACAVYFTGGAASVMVSLYVVIIPAAGLVLSRSDAFMQASLALAVLAGLFGFTAFGQSPYPAFTIGKISLYQSLQEYALSIWLFQASFLYLGAFIAGHIRQQLEASRVIEQRARLQAETLRKMAATLGSTLELNQILGMVLKHLRELVACDGASISLIEGETIGTTASWGAPDPLYQIEPGMLWTTNKMVQSAVTEAKPVFDWDAVVDANSVHGVKIRSRALLPLLIRDEVKGILKVHGTQRTIFDDKEVASIQSLAGHVALAVENARLYERTRQMALTDGLTGLYNRSYFYQQLERELTRSQRYSRKLSLLMCDLDLFKVYNDQYGHMAGDDLLRNLAGVITGVVRKSDQTFRYGGEEFALILPETGLYEALELGERLRRCVEEHLFILAKWSQPTRITISIGAACFPDQAQDLECLVDLADQALFLAKKSRNQVSTLESVRLLGR